MRKLFTLVAMVVAALALTASSAMAQESSVEVVQEGTTTHCTVATCVIIAEGDSSLTVPGMGVISQCNDTFEGGIGEDGSGAVTDVTLAGPNCTSTPCADTPWPFTSGETGPGTEHLTITFCLAGAPPCNAEIDVEEDPANAHHYLLSAVNEPCAGGAILLNGEWEIHDDNTATHDAIDIIH